MKRVLKVFGVLAAVLLMAVCSLFSCNVITVPDYETGRSMTLAEALLKKLEDSLRQKRIEGLSSEYVSYTNSDLGLAFKHPAFLSPKVETSQDRDENGVLRDMTTVTMSSTDPVMGIFLIQLSDPSLTSDSSWYPPDDELLRLYVTMRLSDMQYEKNPENEDAIMAAARAASFTSISGFPAAVYQVAIKGSPFGHIYVRGAEVITPKHLVSLMVMGSDEPSAPGSTTVADLDKVWSQFAASVMLVEVPTNTPRPTQTRPPPTRVRPAVPRSTDTPIAKHGQPVAGANANLRSGPGTTFSIVGSVKAGQALDVVGRNAAGDWLRLASGEWIAARLVNSVGDVPVVDTMTAFGFAPGPPREITVEP
jgi:hypothetical protein